MSVAEERRRAPVGTLRDRAREEVRRSFGAAAAGSRASGHPHDGRAPLEPDGALAWLERFLDGDAPDGAPAAALLGRRAARGYARALAARRGLLERALLAAARLPPTRVGDAPPAPAGTFLHHVAGDPVRVLATLLALPHAHADDTARAALLDYRDALAELGYASPATLAAGLPGAVCLGVLAELPGFPNAAAPVGTADPPPSLRDLLGRVLDLCDTLTLAEPARVLELAADHAAHDRAHRARRLLSTHLERAPGDVACALSLARAERARGRFGRARRLLERVDRKRSTAALADDAPPDVPPPSGADETSVATLAAELARARALCDWIDDAEAPANMPRVTLTDGERERARFDEDTLAAAAELYARHGTLLIDGAFEPALLERCRAQFLDDYRDYLDDRRHADALRIGDRRFQVSLRLAGAFNDPGFYANPFVLALMHRLLDRQVIVGSTVCATSLPGSDDQHLHKDHRSPFTADADDEPIELPPVAITTMIPLVALDERVGTTLVRKGSHRRARRASERMAEQTPIVALGSCFLMDLALSHRGQGNTSERVRPIVNMQYTRRWFVDNKNFRRQRPLEIPREEYARIPDEHRSLFDWARQPGPRVDR